MKRLMLKTIVITFLVVACGTTIAAADGVPFPCWPTVCPSR